MADPDLLIDVQKAIQHALDTGDWIVLLCPDQNTALNYSRILACSVPVGSPFSGRTTRLAKGRVSVASVTDEPFVLSGKPFVLTYAGWNSSSTPVGESKWQTKTSRVITL